MSHKEMFARGEISRAEYRFAEELKRSGNLNMYHILEKKWKQRTKMRKRASKGRAFHKVGY